MSSLEDCSGSKCEYMSTLSLLEIMLKSFILIEVPVFKLSMVSLDFLKNKKNRRTKQKFLTKINAISILYPAELNPLFKKLYKMNQIKNYEQTKNKKFQNSPKISHKVIFCGTHSNSNVCKSQQAYKIFNQIKIKIFSI